MNSDANSGINYKNCPNWGLDLTQPLEIVIAGIRHPKDMKRDAIKEQIPHLFQKEDMTYLAYPDGREPVYLNGLKKIPPIETGLLIDSNIITDDSGLLFRRSIDNPKDLEFYLYRNGNGFFDPYTSEKITGLDRDSKNPYPKDAIAELRFKDNKISIYHVDIETEASDKLTAYFYCTKGIIIPGVYPHVADWEQEDIKLVDLGIDVV